MRFSRIRQSGIYGTVRGVVHDPGHRTVAAAEIAMKSRISDFSRL